MTGGIRIEPYQELANAIVAQAARDYLFLLRLLKHHPEDSEALKKTLEYESFFRSDWYGVLTDVDPEYLISRLRRSVGMAAKGTGGANDSKGISEPGILAGQAD